MFDFNLAAEEGSLWTEVVKCRIPPGLRDRINTAAAAEAISMSEFIRRAMTDRIEAVEAILAGQADNQLRI
ncbi:hypothetical protein [Methylobacterium sp. WL7]|uniref:hypothetical protein n=1 Tax=Methylobacterium sp. WL7 TaxID=2603900 RepID=UPI0011CC7CCE|nr:hypothetical protein [Methylobacterium sp. WL7]TXN43863.1 hypothetical protein FV233_16800 [Methylobacterium sp. WL7]